MNQGRANPALTPTVAERAGVVRGNIEITFARGLRRCASCTRLTKWVIELGPFCKHRRCWKCMTPRERAAFRSGY